MKITKIEDIARDKKRKNIYAEDKYCTKLTVEIIEKNDIYEGQYIERADFESLISESEEAKALDALFTYITKAMKTEGECKKNLFGKGYYSKVVYAVIEKAKGYGYINDENYIRQYISFHSETKGKRRLASELRNKGLDEKLVKEILSETANDESDLVGAETVAGKFMKNKEHNVKDVEKLIRHLISRGYEWGIIGKVIKKYKTGDAFEDME